jgi:hypothetical protein
MDAPGLEFVFEIRLDLIKRERFGPTGAGCDRGFVGLHGGEVKGPRLNGRIVPHVGGDFPSIWADGTVAFDARYIIEADDQTLIEMRNRGYRSGPTDVLDALVRGEERDPSTYYMRVAPSFDAPEGPHRWLARTVFIGTVDRRQDHSVFRYFAVL